MRILENTAVVILNFNGGRETIDCLRSVMELEAGPTTVAICDNHSSDDSWVLLTEWCRDYSSRPPVCRSWPDCAAWGAEKCLEYSARSGQTIALLRTPRNLGFSAGNNVGLRYLLEHDPLDCFWLLNNDTRVEENALLALSEALVANPASGIASSTVRYMDTSGRVQAYGGGRYYPFLGSSTLNGNGQNFTPMEAEARRNEHRDFPLGASMLVTRAFITEIGLMDERFFLYFEEIDWMLRAFGRFSLAYAPQSIVWHKEGSTIGASQSNVGGKSRLGDFHFQRSRLLLTRKHYPHFLPFVVASLVITAGKRILRRQFDRIPMLWTCIREAVRAT